MYQIQENCLSLSQTKSMKGIAAILIAIGHFATYSTPFWIRWILTGDLWVGLFFFYSGYGLTFNYYKKANYLEHFIKKKVIQIYVPFALAEICSMLSATIILSNKITISQIFLGLIGVHLYNGVLWYVVHIAVVYLIFFMFYKYLPSKYIDFLSLMLYISFMLLAVYFDIGAWWYVSTSALIMGLFYGKYEANFKDIIQKNLLLLLLSSSIITALILVAMYTSVATGNNPLGIWNNYYLVGTHLLAVPFFILALLAFLSKYKCNILENRRIQYLGTISFEVYLYHMIVKELVDTFFKDIATYISLSIFLVFSILFAIVAKAINQKLISFINKI